MFDRGCGRAASLALLLGLLLPLNAEAHLGGTSLGDFWVGLLHPLSTLEDALAFLALGMLAGQCERAVAPGFGLKLCVMFAFAVAIGAIAAKCGVSGGWISTVNQLSLLILGGMVVLARPPSKITYLLLLSALGVSHGLFNGVEIFQADTSLGSQLGLAARPSEAPHAARVWLVVPGMTFISFMLPWYAMLAVAHIKPWWAQIGVRVLGSWIAALGLLLLSLHFAPAKTATTRLEIKTPSQQENFHATGRWLLRATVLKPTSEQQLEWRSTFTTLSFELPA